MRSGTDDLTIPAARQLFSMTQASDAIAGLAGAPPSSPSLSHAEWMRLLELSNRNGVTSYVHETLSVCVERDTDAQEVWQLLRDRAMQVARRGLKLRADLIRILRRFAEERIECVPLKGPLLADRYYSKPLLREFGDLDLLVSPVDRDRAWATLESLGYYSPYKNINLDQRYHIVFHQHETNDVVELHWRISGPQFGPYHKGSFLWNNLRPYRYCGVQVSVPTHEAQLLYLAIHAYKHDWSRLQWMIDFREILKGNIQLNWTALDNLARAQGAQRLLRATLQLVWAMFADVVKPPLGHALAVPVLGTRALRQVGSGMVHETSSWRALLNFFLIQLNAAESMSVRRQLTASALSPSERDEEVVALPAVLRSLYFVVRPFRLLKKLLGTH